MSKIAAFIFDMDGVIIDSEPIHSRVKMDTFAHFGIEFNERDLEKYMGRTSGAIFGEVIAERGLDLKMEDVVAYKHAHYIEVLEAGGIEPVAGAVELIHALKAASIPMALATSSNPRVIDIVKRNFHIEDAFDYIISGWELPASKPDPTIYRVAAERLGVEPAECVVLEDTENGLKAAKGAGMRAIAYRNPNSGTQNLELADRVVDSLFDITLDNII